MKILGYWDLSQEDKHGFSSYQTNPNEQTMVLKEQIFPGMHGYPDLYIRQLKLRYENEDYFIISQTDYELTPAKRLEIIADALSFLQQKG